MFTLEDGNKAIPEAWHVQEGPGLQILTPLEGKTAMHLVQDIVPLK